MKGQLNNPSFPFPRGVAESVFALDLKGDYMP